ncbi:uncharacterized protein C8Q71DRAFT_854375 [Rhodofomes roseus]|uniref:Uncharacterized protein n=1 Tax=Rhodofomes roseus TaxID=34475 RepID=A0ABQ8KVG1_9APHY|nr:uncharacterized protein C8Q71DRAFT_854375 [Rhodofomes roseus]KAH9842023.1 hypothetical protein C8Q71DRAFT_854375 [Rhodofomes roseus]
MPIPAFLTDAIRHVLGALRGAPEVERGTQIFAVECYRTVHLGRTPAGGPHPLNASRTASGLLIFIPLPDGKYCLYLTATNDPVHVMQPVHAMQVVRSWAVRLVAYEPETTVVWIDETSNKVFQVKFYTVTTFRSIRMKLSWVALFVLFLVCMICVLVSV